MSEAGVGAHKERLRRPRSQQLERLSILLATYAWRRPKSHALRHGTQFISAVVDNLISNELKTTNNSLSFKLYSYSYIFKSFEYKNK